MLQIWFKGIATLVSIVLTSVHVPELWSDVAEKIWKQYQKGYLLTRLNCKPF